MKGRNELSLSLFAFLYHFVWEMWQIPFFDEMMAASHWDGVVFCTQASVGDAVIAVACYWAIALIFGRSWIVRPRWIETGTFVVAALLATIVLEMVNTGIGRWSYSEMMPVMPGLDVGLLPIAQWIVLSPLIVQTTARFIRGGSASSSVQNTG